METNASFIMAEAVRRISEVDMLEENEAPLPLQGGRLAVSFGAFEIKSFLLYP